jgi:hypothetical protein
MSLSVTSRRKNSVPAHVAQLDVVAAASADDKGCLEHQRSLTDDTSDDDEEEEDDADAVRAFFVVDCCCCCCDEDSSCDGAGSVSLRTSYSVIIAADASCGMDDDDDDEDEEEAIADDDADFDFEEDEDGLRNFRSSSSAKHTFSSCGLSLFRRSAIPSSRCVREKRMRPSMLFSIARLPTCGIARKVKNLIVRTKGKHTDTTTGDSQLPSS